MMDERWTSQKAPLLVLSCTNSSDVEESKLTCFDVVEELKLCEMNRRWQVNIQYFTKACDDSALGTKVERGLPSP